MMRQRGDFDVLHEPFNEVYYYGTDRISRRNLDVEPQPGLSYASAWSDIQNRSQNCRVFLKEFSYSLEHMLDDGFLNRMQHTFLIRDPKKSLPSIHAHWPDFSLAEAGFNSQRQLFDRLCDRDGQAPPVIDSDAFLDAPAEVVEAYCAAVGIAYMPQALNWESGERNEVSWYDGGSWHGSLRQSTGIKRQKRAYVPIDHNDHLRRAYDACRPDYEALRKHLIGATGSGPAPATEIREGSRL
jgi:hypothetical protein